jgi:transcriptional regulator with XRE-family HTH domain
MEIMMAKLKMAVTPNPQRATKGKSNQIDVYVGSRVRQCRMLLGMSQEVLGKSVGLTFQKIQKYERGVNRIGACRLFSLGRALNIPVAFFFEDMPKELEATGTPTAPGFGESTAAPYEANPLANREAAELVRAYLRIKDTNQRRKVLDLVRSLVD